MRSALLLAVLLVLSAAPAFAGDGNVPRGILSSLGLGEMQVISDAEGMQVRGQASVAGRVTGTSLILYQLLAEDPPTPHVDAGSSVKSVLVSASAPGGTLSVTASHAVSISRTLSVTFPDLSTYFGSVRGSASGFGSVTASVP